MTSGIQKSNAVNLYDFTAKTQSGEELNLDKYKGEVVLIVNTACNHPTDWLIQKLRFRYLCQEVQRN